MVIAQPVTISEELLRRADAWAAQHQVSRERVVEITLENLFATAISSSHEREDEEDAEEERYLRAIRAKQAHTLRSLDEYTE